MSISSKNLFISSGLVLAMMSMMPAASAQTVSESLTDVRQEVQIWTTYSLNPYLRASALKATVRDGKATLTGSVPESVNKELAREIAMGVPGIKEVDNQIVVRDDDDDDHHASADRFGEEIDDATITLAVKSKLLWSKYTDGLNTIVHTQSGRVTLTGTADSQAARELAVRLASNTRGVISVRNNITIAPVGSKGNGTSGNLIGMPAGTVVPPVSVVKIEKAVSDSWITTKVKSTLLYSTNVSGSDITVKTVAGVVTLTGDLDSGAERALAIELTQNVRGVKSVNAQHLTH